MHFYVLYGINHLQVILRPDLSPLTTELFAELQTRYDTKGKQWFKRLVDSCTSNDRIDGIGEEVKKSLEDLYISIAQWRLGRKDFKINFCVSTYPWLYNELTVQLTHGF